MTKKNSFSRSFYQWTRDLHLYFGVFLCPLLVLFAVSTVLMIHGVAASTDESSKTVTLAIPDSIQENLALADEKAEAARQATEEAERSELTEAASAAANAAASELTEHALATLGLSGEVLAFGPVRDNKKTIIVMVPSQMTVVTVDVAKQEAIVVERRHGFLDTMRYLHRNPGPHKVQGPNWIGSIAWRWIADTTVCLTLFLTVSGIYLWYMIKAERKLGLIFLGSGCVSLIAILYALLKA